MENTQPNTPAPITALKMVNRAVAERDGLKILGQSDENTVIVATYQKGTQA